MFSFMSNILFRLICGGISPDYFVAYLQFGGLVWKMSTI